MLFIWMIHLQCILFLLSFYESFIPAKFQGLSKRKCVGLFPLKFSSHGFCRFIFEPFSFHHYAVSTVYESRFSELEKIFHNWFPDPGITDLDIRDGVMDLWSNPRYGCKIHQRSWHSQRQRLQPTREKMMRSSDILFLLPIRRHIFHHEQMELLETSTILISTRRQSSDSSPKIFLLIVLVNVMLYAFWNFISKMIASINDMKGGHNRIHLLAYKTSLWKAWLLSTPSYKLF